MARMQTNADLTRSLVPRLARSARRTEGVPSERIPVEAACAILSFIGCNYVAGRDLHIIAEKRRNALWLNFRNAILIPAAKDGHRTICLDSDAICDHFCNFGIPDITELAMTKGVKIDGCSPLRLVWSRRAGDLYRIAEEAVWSKLRDDMMLPAAREGYLSINIFWESISHRLGGFEQDELETLADQHGVKMEVRRSGGERGDACWFTWQESSDLYESASRARQIAWTHFCDRWLRPSAARGRFCFRLDRALVLEHFGVFVYTEIVETASLHGVAMIAECRHHVKSVLFVWRDQSELKRSALGALPCLWIQFYDAVLVPAAKSGKLDVHLRKRESDIYFEWLCYTLLAKVARVNGVDVAREGDGVRLSWREPFY
eukprot:TRINITY_DN27186_c0_g1_i1.p1 TRINITY_DN27186_c0_g1~~TRINITY_DN27186_c0_g1_i1.p1  ORF type:complete len:374 (-),score=40.75 TRINITY_DN27186_c0_g1_i1:169-1290(-)